MFDKGMKSSQHSVFFTGNPRGVSGFWHQPDDHDIDTPLSFPKVVPVASCDSAVISKQGLAVFDLCILREPAGNTGR